MPLPGFRRTQAVATPTKTIAWARVFGQLRGRLLPYSDSGHFNAFNTLSTARGSFAGHAS
jgi:hypothetical protein